MQREIKFRAYDVIGHKFVYGDLVHNQKVTKEGLEPRTMVGGYEVDPKSVQQFTGLHDKKGNEIYEGDILRIDCSPAWCFEATVIFSKTTAAFLLDEGENCFSPIPPSCSEIIGNIYEKSLHQ